MASEKPTARDLVRQALDAEDVAQKTRDPAQRATLEEASRDLLQRAEKALAEQQGDKPLRGV